MFVIIKEWGCFARQKAGFTTEDAEKDQNIGEKTKGKTKSKIHRGATPRTEGAEDFPRTKGAEDKLKDTEERKKGRKI